MVFDGRGSDVLRAAVRAISIGRFARADSRGRSRHATAAADLRPRQGGGARQRRAARPPRHRVAGRPKARRSGRQPPSPAGVDRAPWSATGATRRARALFVGAPGARVGRRPASCAAAADRSDGAAAGAADSFLIVNGDTLTDLRLRRLIDHAPAYRRASVTMALIPNPRPDIYGGVRVEDGWITGFTRPGTAERELSLHRRAGRRSARRSPTLEDGVPAESVILALSAAHPRNAARRRRRSSSTRRSATSGPRPTTCRRRWTSPRREGDHLVSGASDRIDPSASVHANRGLG